jgi:hypothetical protein
MSDVQKWVATLDALAAEIVATGRPPRAQSACQRCSQWACCSLACLPCCLWSTLWRAVVCPCMCLVRGPRFACSNNGCTDATDACISRCAESIERRRVLPPMPPLTAATPASDIEALTAALAGLEARFQAPLLHKSTAAAPAATTARYVLVDVVVKPLVRDRYVVPANAAQALHALRVRLQQDHGPLPVSASPPSDTV